MFLVNGKASKSYFQISTDTWSLISTYPLAGPPTETTCRGKGPRPPRPRLLPAQWPTTVPAISSFPPWEGIGWIPTQPREKNKNPLNARIKNGEEKRKTRKHFPFRCGLCLHEGLFCLSQYVQNNIIWTCNQYKKLLMKSFALFFPY